MITAAIFWFFAILPAVIHPYLLYAYVRRFGQRKELIRSLLTNSNAIAEYSRAFRSSADLHSDEWKRRLDLDIESYVYPTALCSLLSLAGAVAMISASSDNALRLPVAVFNYLRQLSPAALAGFAGAYIWGLYDFTDRFRILNLPAGALHGMWFRMILATAAAAFAAAVLTEAAAPIAGFVIGMLPVAMVISWLQDNARQRLGIAKSVEVPPLWEHIQGLTPDIVARLEEAGVTSAPHLANQDPIGLLRRTNIEWRNMLDMMDQAFLLTYVGAPLEKLRVMGIRGAIEAAILYRHLTDESDPHGEAHTTLKALSVALAVEPLVAQNLLRNLAEDPQVGLVWSLWYDRAATPSPAAQDTNPVERK